MIKKIIAILIVVLVFFSLGYAEEDIEISLTDLHIEPNFIITSPQVDKSYENGGKLKISTKGQNTLSYRVELVWGENALIEEVVDEDMEIELSFSPTSLEMVLNITAFENDDFSGLQTQKQMIIISPKQELINRMIDLAYANSKDKKYNFAPAEEDHHIGVCKNFVMRLFDTFSKEYRMENYSDLVLHMPKNRSLKDSKPYQYGLEWRIESAEDGSPFEIAQQFKYNKDISKEENYKLAYDLMTKIQKGDFFQMVGYYGGGNGPHSLFFIEDFDPISTNLHWTDSNMFGKRVDGIRWGYMQFDAVKNAEWFANVFNMKDRGATIYRLRDDLIKP